MIVSFIQNSNCIDISKWMAFCIGAVFTEKHGPCISHERAHCLANINLNLIWSNKKKSNLAIKSPVS